MRARVKPAPRQEHCAFHGQPVDPAKPRVAKCASCDSTRPSAERATLAFFEDKSKCDDTCKHCHFHRVAHEPEGVARNVDPRTVIETGECTGFEPHGAWAWDSYYCGCRGWD